MKSKIKISGLLIVMVMFLVTFTKEAVAQRSDVSFQVFYDQLSPYGQWVDFPNYGFVWIPDAGSDFVPYSTGGHWIMTEYGWTWASDYDWGWAPFHYGRWDYDNGYGWFWIPDNEWGPAWVTWRRAEGYYGWSPMGPGISISMSFGNGYNNYNNRWIFVNDRYFGRRDINRYYANRNDYERIYRGSNIINNTYDDSRRQTRYVSGPDRADVQRVTGRRISSYTIQENNTPGQNLRNGQFHTYRPQVIKNNDSQQRPTPTRVTNLQDIRPPSERNTANLNKKNPVQVQQQNTVNRQNAATKQNDVNQQNAVNRRNTIKQQDAVKQQNAIKQQEALKQQNAVKQQEVVNQQNAVKRQNEVNQQNAVKQQEAVNQQNAVKQQNEVNQQNAVKQQNEVNQQNAVNRQNEVNQQNAVKRQNEVNQQNAVRQQNEIKQQNAVKQQEVVKQQNEVKQQNVRTTNSNKKQPVTTVKTTKKIKTVQPKQSTTEKDKTKNN
jgi:hypothetical protein